MQIVLRLFLGVKPHFFGLMCYNKLSNPRAYTTVRRGQHVTYPFYTAPLSLADALAVKAQYGADARILECSDLQADQSTLSGESSPLRKTHDPIHTENLATTDTPNLLFAGTSVSSGTGRAVVMTIGMQTVFGGIAHLTQSMKDEPSPLQRELDRLTKQLSVIALVTGAVFFLAGVFVVNEPWPKAFIFALGMIVAFIPEGLLPTVTLSLAMAVQRMSKQHALVKKLSAVETLGCTTVICSDKTGTLTQNEMTVTRIWSANQFVSVTGTGYAPKGEFQVDGNKVSLDKFPAILTTLWLGVIKLFVAS